MLKTELILGNEATSALCEDISVCVDLLGKIAFLGIKDDKFSTILVWDMEEVDKYSLKLIISAILSWDVVEVQTITPISFDIQALKDVKKVLNMLGIDFWVNCNEQDELD